MFSTLTFPTDLQTWTNAKPTNTTVWETNDVKISTEDTSVGMWVCQ